MLTTLQGDMIIFFMLLCSVVGSLINGTSPLTTTMNMLGYEPISPIDSPVNVTALQTVGTHTKTTALHSVRTQLKDTNLQTVKTHQKSTARQSVRTHSTSTTLQTDRTAKSSVKKKRSGTPPKQTNYITKHIDSCPDVGYFFKKEPKQPKQPNSVDAPKCFLCFCSDPKWAICWPRENSRCDNEHYHHHGVGKRDARARRSPGFSDIFFRDASLDIFGKNSPEQCKPHESSFSEGCPPADWCIGCTVCDCDSNGRWDCHTLSFCPEQVKKEKKKDRPRHRHYRYDKRKIYKQAGSTNAISTQKDIGKVKSKTTQKGQGDVKTTNPKVIVHKKGPQRNQTAKKKSQGRKSNDLLMSGSKPSKKSTTQVVKTPIKKTQDVKKSMRRNGIISKRDAKNSNAPLQKNAPKRNGTLSKNKTNKVQSGKAIPPKNNQTKKGNLVKKAKSVEKAVTPKKTTEAKENLRESLMPKPRRNLSSQGAKAVRTTKKPFARKVQAKKLKGSKKNATKKEKSSQENKNKKSRRMNKEAIDNMHSYLKQFNLTEDTIKKAMEETKMKAQKHIQKRSIAGNSMEYDTMDSTDQEREKRHVDNAMENINDTKVNGTSGINVTEIEIDKMGLVNSTTSKYFTINVDFLNETIGETIFVNKKPIEVNVSTENALNENKTTNITTKSLIINETGKFSTTSSNVVIETTTNMDVEPTVSLSSYYSYSVDDGIKTTPVFQHIMKKTKVPSAKRSLADQNLINNASEVLKIAEFGNNTRSIRTTEPVIITTAIESQSRQSASTAKVEGKLEDKISTNESNSRLESVNITMKDLRRKIYRADLTRKVGGSEKKYKLRKIVNVYNRNGTRLDERLRAIINNNKKNITTMRLSSFQNFIRNHITFSKRRNATNKSRIRNLKVLKYLKKFFRQILSRENIVSQNGTTSLTINKNKFIKTLCDTFGPCYMSQQKRLILNAKIDDLGLESNRMFKTIKTLRGQLKLLDLHKNETKQKKRNGEDKYFVTFNTDIIKLSSVLRDNYTEDNKGNLTTEALNQISYIKRNMQYFTQSTASFAKILNEIIDILTTPTNTPSFNEKYSKPEKQVETFKKLKDLLITYKLLQNRFLQKMYEILAHIYPAQPDNKTSIVDKSNKTVPLIVYTKNIIKNLRKLKTLANFALSNKTTHARKRRDIRDEDSMEYILVLMEYLLKQNYHRDPVPDGLDILIEAIRNAPDIKLIKQQVMQKNQLAHDDMNSHNPINKNSIPKNTSDDNVSELNKVSKEFNYTSAQDDSKMNNPDSSDSESDFEYLPVMNRRANDEITMTTVVNDYVKYDTEQATEATDVTSARSQTESSYVLSHVSSTLHTMIDEESNKFGKVLNSGEGDEFEKRMEMFNSELDDDSLNIPLATSTMHSIHKSRHNIQAATERAHLSEIITEKYIEKSNHDAKDTDTESENYKNDLKNDLSLIMSESKNKKYLDWLDESFEEEIKAINHTEKVKPLLENWPSHEVITKRHPKEHSKTSKGTENAKKRLSDLDEKIYSQEMNMLNSIDDKVGKSDSAEGSDSKESSEMHHDSD